VSAAVTNIIPDVTVIVPLNADFRIIVLSADAQQFVLERYDDFDGLWRARTSCRSRDALEKVIRLYAGDVDPLALAALHLPTETAAPKTKTKKLRAG
jgi:hypothetical protein